MQHLKLKRDEAIAKSTTQLGCLPACTMLRRRFGNLQLGPPLRATNDEDDEEVDGCAITEPSKANKENARTPVTCATIPGGNDSHWSAKKAGLPLRAKQVTPSSTCPNSWNPGDPAMGGQKINEPQTNASVGKLLRGAPSTIPDHLGSPRVPSGRKPRKRQDSASRRTPVCSTARAPTAVVHGTNGEPGCKTFPQESGPPSDPKLLPSKTGTVASHPVPRRTTTKPPVDPSSARMSSRTAPCPTPLLFASPEKKDVVVMASPNGEERRFQKLTLVGCGGSSKVYKVLSEDYRIYAVKEVYMKHVDPAIKKAYVNEVKLLTKLRERPEIVTLYDYTWDRQEGILYLLLEYAEMDLNAVVKNNKWPDPILSAAYFWKEMVQVVKVIHDQGIIHNDLKPENFVCIGARLKLIDFGIASRIEAEKTSVERDIRCGTINYMAPETVETYEDNDYFKVGRPSDVWSLGCILYLMVYGRTPFEHIRNKILKWQAITDPSVPIAFPDCGNAAIVDVMKRCLVRNPKERPTITELLSLSLF